MILSVLHGCQLVIAACDIGTDEKYVLMVPIKVEDDWPVCSEQPTKDGEFSADADGDAAASYRDDHDDEALMKPILDNRKLHSGSRFSSQHCKKRFTHACDVEKHVRNRTKEKPFACSLCVKKFTQSISLYLHMCKFHPDVPYAQHSASHSSFGKC